MNDAVRNLALQDLHERLQKIGKEKGVELFPQLPKLDQSAASMTQLEAAERSFAKADMERQLQEDLPRLQDNPEQLAVWNAVKDAIDGNTPSDVSQHAQHSCASYFQC